VCTFGCGLVIVFPGTSRTTNPTLPLGLLLVEGTLFLPFYFFVFYLIAFKLFFIYVVLFVACIKNSQPNPVTWPAPRGRYTFLLFYLIAFKLYFLFFYLVALFMLYFLLRASKTTNPTLPLGLLLVEGTPFYFFVFYLIVFMLYFLFYLVVLFMLYFLLRASRTTNPTLPLGLLLVEGTFFTFLFFI
jgi:hypothetical protein